MQKRFLYVFYKINIYILFFSINMMGGIGDYGLCLEKVLSEEEADKIVLKFILTPIPGIPLKENAKFYFSKIAIKSGIDYLKYLAKDLKNYIVGK